MILIIDHFTLDLISTKLNELLCKRNSKFINYYNKNDKNKIYHFIISNTSDVIFSGKIKEIIKQINKENEKQMKIYFEKV